MINICKIKWLYYTPKQVSQNSTNQARGYLDLPSLLGRKNGFKLRKFPPAQKNKTIIWSAPLNALRFQIGETFELVSALLNERFEIYIWNGNTLEKLTKEQNLLQQLNNAKPMNGAQYEEQLLEKNFSPFTCAHIDYLQAIKIHEQGKSQNSLISEADSKLVIPFEDITQFDLDLLDESEYTIYYQYDDKKALLSEKLPRKIGIYNLHYCDPALIKKIGTDRIEYLECNDLKSSNFEKIVSLKFDKLAKINLMIFNKKESLQLINNHAAQLISIKLIKYSNYIDDYEGPTLPQLKNLNLQNFDFPFLKSILERSPNIRTLTIKGDSGDLSLINGDFSELAELSLSCCGISYEQLNLFLQKAPKLKKVRLYLCYRVGNENNGPLDKFHQLTSLEITQGLQDIASFILKNSTQLESLKIDDFFSMVQEEFHLPKLACLEISRCRAKFKSNNLREVHYNNEERVAQGSKPAILITEIASLDDESFFQNASSIQITTSIEWHVVEKLFEIAPNLRYLDVRDFGDKKLMPSEFAFAQLEILRIDDIDKRKNLDCLIRFPGLKYLNLVFQCVTVIHFCKIIKNAVLEYLKLEYAQLDFQDIIETLSGLPNLVAFEMRHCSGLSARELDEIARRFPHILFHNYPRIIQSNAVQAQLEPQSSFSKTIQQGATLIGGALLAPFVAPLALALYLRPDTATPNQANNDNDAFLKQANWHSKAQIELSLSFNNLFRIDAKKQNFFAEGAEHISKLHYRSHVLYFNRQKFEAINIDPNEGQIALQLDSCSIAVGSYSRKAIEEQSANKQNLLHIDHKLEKIKKDHYYVLPAASSSDKLLAFYASCDCHYELFRHPVTGLHYVKFDKDLTAPVTVNYSLETNLKNYASTLAPSADTHDLRFRFDEHHRLIIPDAFKNRSRAQQLADLIDHLKSFTDDELSMWDVFQSLPNRRLSQMKGVCYDRSWLFIAVASFLGIKARLIQNPLHAFVEVYEDSEWRYIDLGGGEVKFEYVNTNATDNNVLERRPTLTQSNAGPVVQEQQTVLSASKPVTDFIDNGDAFKNALFIFNSDRSFTQINDHLMSSLKEDCYYLHDLDNITTETLVVNQDGQRLYEESEFVQFLNKNTQRTLMVNLNGLTSKQLAYYIKIIDDRIFNKKQCGENLQILFEVSKENAALLREDFYSRMDKDKILTPQPDYSASSNKQYRVNENSAIINLYEDSASWKSRVLGHYWVRGDTTTTVVGALIKAIQENSGIILCNPPDDPEFDRFINDIKLRRTFAFNGERYFLPKDFQIITKNEPYHLAPCFTVKCVASDALNAVNWDYVLNVETFAQFFTTYSCNAGKLYTNKGWLTQRESLSILMTEEMPLSALAQLLDFAMQNHIKIQFVIPNNVIAPAELINEAMFISAPEVKAPPVRIIHSADVDITIKNLQERIQSNENIFYLNAESYGELIEYFSTTGEQSSMVFSMEYGALVDALKSGKDVILTGDFSSNFLKQIETLLADKPYLWIRGEKHYIQSKVWLVSNTAISFPGVTPEKQEFTQTDLLFEFKFNFDISAESFAKVERTIKRLRKENVIFSYIQINHILQMVRDNPRKNPFKSFLREHSDANRLLEIVRLEYPKKPKRYHDDDIITHRLDKIHHVLNYSPFAFLSGPTGTGKSSLIPDLKKSHEVFVDFEKIGEWIACDPDKNPLLFLDEANIADSRTWNIFENLFKDPPFILLNGKKQVLSKKHKVIFAGNPASYQGGREAQQLFLRHGTVIEIKPFPNAFLKKNILIPTFTKTCPDLDKNLQEIIIDQFLQIYDQANQQLLDTKCPFVLSPRNLEMMANRFAWLRNKMPNMPYASLARLCAYLEIKSHFPQKAARRAFKEAVFMADPLHSQQEVLTSWRKIKFSGYNANYKPIMINDFAITKSRISPLFKLTEFLGIRKMLLDKKIFSSMNGLLFEGESGIGKTSMIKAYLDQQHIEYVTLNPGTEEEMRQVLTDAFYQGKIVLIDEINTLDLEPILNKLMMGAAGNPDVMPGFGVIATANPASYPGRDPLSPASLNRFLRILLKTYPAEDLMQILLAKNQPYEKVARHIADYVENMRNPDFTQRTTARSVIAGCS